MSAKQPDETLQDNKQPPEAGVGRSSLLQGTSALVAAATTGAVLPATAVSQGAPAANTSGAPAMPKSTIDRTSLPLPEPEFKGVIGKTYKDSKADWPKPDAPPEGAPNIAVI